MISGINFKKTKFVLFVTVFVVTTFYIFLVRSELYLSTSSTLVKDLTSSAPQIDGIELFSVASTSTLQDARVVQDYLSSYDELQKLDKQFHLNAHYHSDVVDPLDRLYDFSTREDFLALYQKRLELIFEETSGILTIGFLHTDPNVAQAVVKELIEDANERINQYNHVVGEKKLSFITTQVGLNKKALNDSIDELEAFQNTHTLLDPMADAQTQGGIVAQLEASLVEKENKLGELRNYMNEKSFEVVRLKHEIDELKKALSKIRKTMASGDESSLNAVIFEYERLKNNIEFNKGIYKQSLIELESIKAEISKNAKMLLVLVNPYLPDGYTYPRKAEAVLTLILVLGLLFGIISMIESIVNEHFD